MVNGEATSKGDGGRRRRTRWGSGSTAGGRCTGDNLYDAFTHPGNAAGQRFTTVKLTPTVAVYSGDSF